MRRLAVLVASCLLIAGACSSDSDELPPPPPTSSTTATTAAPDFSTVGLDRVPGTTTTRPPALGPGAASLSGIAVGPDGPVAGADVLIERIVGGSTVSAPPRTTDGDGRWALPGVMGGRYRVRAFLAPELAQVEPTLVFLTATETQELTLRMERYRGLAVAFDVAPSPPEIGERVSLVVQATERTVDDNGVVIADPLDGERVELFAEQWELHTENPTTSDRQGEASWVIRCRSEGRHQVAVTIGDSTAQFLEVPACVRNRPPPTSSTTSTTSRSRRSTTTTRRSTTTAPD